MLNIIENSSDFVAIEMGGRLSSEEIGRMVDMMLAATEANQKTHLFAEVKELGSVEFDGMVGHVKRSLPLFGRLDRFGRIAIVSGQAWLRAISKIESAVLPNISYETFLPEERDRAYAWAKGEA